LSRFWNVVRFEKKDYEFLSRESLWSLEEAVSFAANYSVAIAGGFKNDDWKAALRKQNDRFDKLIFTWCESKALFPLSKAGIHDRPLREEEWRTTELLEDINGDILDTFEAVTKEDVYFHRDHFLRCLRNNGLKVSEDLWASVCPKKGSDEKPRKLRDNQVDRLVCQGIAKTLWDINPDMTIEDMVNHKAVQIYGNAKLYTEPETIRKWLREVDPRDPDKKTGPKKKS